jgi:two-component system OmpR family response regulator
MHAVLRRQKPRIDQLTLGNTVVDFRRLRACCGAKPVELTDHEFEILRCLAERAGNVVTRNELMHLVWGYADAPLTRTADHFVLQRERDVDRPMSHSFSTPLV